jgi:2-keto-4-pentenoate hydratase
LERSQDGSPEIVTANHPIEALSAAEHRQMADALRAAEVERSPIPRPTLSYADMTAADGYRVQLLNVERRVATGAVVRGHKVGLSSRTMQQMMGVNEPDYGQLLSDMFVPEYTPIRVGALCAPRVEVEVAFVLGEPLPAPGCTVADVLRCTAYVCPALEIIDSRIENWDIRLPDTVADNASAGLVVLGGRATLVDRVDLRTIGAALRRNGSIIATGAAGAVLGNPATSVAWLANKVHGFGVRLDAGHVILPGSCTRAYDVAAGHTMRADFDQLGHVVARFE